MTALTQRFTDAVDYARIAHAGQVRKGSDIPYLYHLLGVASLVLEFGGNEDQAVAGLLHDVVEDCGARHALKVRRKFGDAVADIVEACTDGSAESKAQMQSDVSRREDWLGRKLNYLRHLEDNASGAALLVSACDKLHNARAVAGDIEDPEVGLKVFERFTGGRDGTLRYYHSLSQVFSRKQSPVARTLDATVARMHAEVAALSGEPVVRRPLSRGD